MFYKWLVFAGLSSLISGQGAQMSTDSNLNLVIFSHLKLSITDSIGEILESHDLISNKKEAFSLANGQILRFHFTANKGKAGKDSGSLEPLKLDQAVALFNHTFSGTITYAPFGSSKIGSYRLNLGGKNFPKFVQANPGEYEVTIFASATQDVLPAKFFVGFINFASTAASVSASSERYGPRPLIHHTFRHPDPIPSSILSLTFSVIVLTPWLFLIGAWSNLGVNLSALPWSFPGRLLAAFSFLISLGLNIGLSYLYWIEVPLFKTLLYFLPIGLSTIISGCFALNHVQNRRNLTLK